MNYKKLNKLMDSEHGDPVTKLGKQSISVADFLHGGYNNVKVNVVYIDPNSHGDVIVIKHPNKEKYQDFFLNGDEWMMLTVKDNDEDPKETWKEYNNDLEAPNWLTKEKLMTADDLETCVID